MNKWIVWILGGILAFVIMPWTMMVWLYDMFCDLFSGDDKW